jgi:hypothetical protein
MFARFSAVAVVFGLVLSFAGEATAQPPVKKKGNQRNQKPNNPRVVGPSGLPIVGSTGVAGITPVQASKGAIIYPYNPFNPLQNMFPLSGQNPYLNPYLSNPMTNPYTFSPFMSPFMNPLSVNPFMTTYSPFMSNPYMTNPFMTNPFAYGPFTNPIGLYPANPFQNPMIPFQPAMQNPFLPGVQPIGGAFGF